MIKFKKMMNSRNASPEIVEIYVSLPYGCKRGKLYQFSGTQLTLHKGTQEKSTFVPINTYPASSGCYIRGFFPTEDTLFESRLYGDTTKVSSGYSVAPEIDDTSELLGLSCAAGNFAVIHEIFNTEGVATATFTLILH